MENSNYKCPKCNNTGIVKEKDGTIHTCYDCLQKDMFEQHGKPKDTGIKI
jgi:ribosomal protein L37AE/L43A